MDEGEKKARAVEAALSSREGRAALRVLLGTVVGEELAFAGAPSLAGVSSEERALVWARCMRRVEGTPEWGAFKASRGVRAPSPEQQPSWKESGGGEGWGGAGKVLSAAEVADAARRVNDARREAALATAAKWLVLAEREAARE